MKKLVLVICMMLSFTAVSLAQKNEIGIKVGCIIRSITTHYFDEMN